VEKRGTLYIIGIDSAPLWILQKFRESRGMEGFRALSEKGELTNMRSTLLPLTAPSWSSMYTGLEPREHGVPEFIVITRDYVLDTTKFEPKTTPPFYYEAAEAGLRSLIVTPAMDTTLPPESIGRNMDMITGFPLPANTNSQHLRELMKKHGFHGEPEIERDINKGKMGDAEAVETYKGSIIARRELAEDAIGSGGYDLVYVCFTETDRVHHFMMNKPEADKYNLEIYSEISKFVEFIMSRVEKEGGAMMIVSDHGAQPIKKEFLVNGWLIANGFATLKKNVLEGVQKAHSAPASEKKGEGVKYRIREMALRSGAREVYEKAPYAIKKAVFKTFGNLLSSAGGSGDYIRILPTDFDLKGTKAFGAISVLPTSTIWINDGRFVEGQVRKEERDALVKEITEKLKSVDDGNGRKLVVNVTDGADYYRGVTDFIPPDIIFEVAEGYTIDPYHFSMDYMFMNPSGPKNGDHLKNGIFGYYSNGSSCDTEGIRVMDVAPIVLDYFGIAKGSKRSRLKRKG
jgi:predicted AlkP superfamily phosphohydrolase/phosphomutase